MQKESAERKVAGGAGAAHKSSHGTDLAENEAEFTRLLPCTEERGCAAKAVFDCIALIFCPACPLHFVLLSDWEIGTTCEVLGGATVAVLPIGASETIQEITTLNE